MVPGQMETIAPVCLAPGEVLRCTTHISASAEDLVAYKRGCDSEAQVYLDGSGLDNMAGTVAVLYREGKSPRMLRFRLGELTVHAMFEAEAVGVLLALHLLRHAPNVQRATIHLDYQAVIESLHIHKPRPVQYLIDEIIHQVDNIWRRATHPSSRLEILWVKGHGDSTGNERVDQEAKKASKGATSKESLLPCFLTECELLMMMRPAHR